MRRAHSDGHLLSERWPRLSGPRGQRATLGRPSAGRSGPAVKRPDRGTEARRHERGRRSCAPDTTRSKRSELQFRPNRKGEVGGDSLASLVVRSLRGMSRRNRRGYDYVLYLPDPLMGWDLTLTADVAADVADAKAAGPA